MTLTQKIEKDTRMLSAMDGHDAYETLMRLARGRVERGQAATLGEALVAVARDHGDLYETYSREGHRGGYTATERQAEDDRAQGVAWTIIKERAEALVKQGKAGSFPQAVETVAKADASLYERYRKEVSRG